MCEKKAYEMFKEAWETVDFKPTYIMKTEEAYIFQWEFVKWYDCFKEVQAIESVVDALNEYAETYYVEDDAGYAYKVIEIAEDNAIREYYNDRGEWLFEDFKVVTSVKLPPETVKIEE